jgi:hypothetical protein
VLPSESLRGLTEEQLMTMSASELRRQSLESLVDLMHELGLSTDGVTQREKAIATIVANAYEIH